MAREYVVVDLETTGLDLATESIIEIAAVKMRRGLVVDTFTSLVDCGRPLSGEIIRLTGISDEMLAGQPDIYQLLPAFSEFIGAADIVAHNASFDASFLRKYWPDEREWIDSITLAQIAFPCAASYALRNITLALGIEHAQAHRALDDALATAELLLRIGKELESLPPAAKQDLLALAQGDTSPTGTFIKHKCGQVGTAAADVVPGPAAPATKADKRPVDESFRLDLSELAAYLGPESKYRERLPGFEERPQQLDLSLAVGEALNNSSCLLAEAGTGIGKSLAYLLPAALYAAGSGRQVAISTHTRNLQEQLLHKDIPLLGQLLGREVKAAVVKGRNNYLCRRMYKYLLAHAPENLRYFLMRVAVWRAKSGGWDGSELNLTSFDQWKWQRVSAAKENCAPFCPYGRRNACIVQRQRAEAARAEIVILNHSLLVANASLDKGFLPPLPNLIIDEAQHLERAAEDQLTAGVDIFAVLDLLGRLTRREKGRSVGALATLRQHLNQLPPGLLAPAGQILDNLEVDCGQVIKDAERFFDLISALFRADAAQAAFYPAQVRVMPRHRVSEEWQLVVEQGGEFAAALDHLAQNCFRLLDLLHSVGEEGDAEEGQPGREELFASGSLARELAGTLRACLAEEDNYVAWAEFPDETKKPSVRIAPIEIGVALRSCLYETARSLVMTSATLAVGRDFGYFKQRLGLDLLPEPPREMIMPSPFFYRDQALFTVVNDLPDWSKTSEIAATEAIAGALLQLVAASQGRAIVLFTSHHQLKAVFNLLRQPLQEQGVTLLAHGVSGGPSGLLTRLKSGERCCILGANSFWEGVDVIGAALSLIVVVRLPFWPPHSPLTAARLERIEAEGRSSFGEYSLPQALIRFKQGFGRLIRSETDSGVFCVLDKRIVEKGYGARFIRSLPEMRRIVGSSEQIADEIKKWLA